MDENHEHKIWPTFERECFKPRIPDASVIPIYLDDTKFVGIPDDIIGFSFQGQKFDDEEFITDTVGLKLEERLQNA